MLPTRLELRNFLAYRQPDPIILDGLHLACLTGPNGAGKSSLLDAITWALWGKARVRSDDDLIYQGQQDMVVQLDFLQGEDKYRVVRRRQRGKTARSGRSQLDFHVWDNEGNTWQLISAPSVRETDHRITELLRLDYNTFVHSAFLQQGRADAFTIQTPGQRKAILSDILGLDQWQVYENRTKERLRQIDHNLEVIALQLDEIEREEAKEPSLKRDLDDAQAALADATQLREEAEARYNEVAGAQDQMNAATAHLAQAEHRIKQRQRDLDETEAELERYAKQLERLSALVDDQDSIQAGYAQLQAAREADQQLGEKLQVMSAIKDRLAETDKRIQAERNDLEQQATTHRTRMQDAERRASELDDLHADLDDVRAEVIRLEAEEKRRDELRTTINALNEENAELKAHNETLYAEMKRLETRINQLSQAEATCPLCGQPLEGDHKETLLAEITAEGTDRGDAYRANVARRDAITEAIKTHQAEIAAVESELKRLQPLRDRVAQLQSRVEDAQTAAATLQTELSELQVIETMLEAGEYAQELRVQRDTIQGEIDALGYDSEAHTAARETLSVYAAYDSRQRDLEAALKQLPEVEQSLEHAEARRERWLKVLEDEEQERDTAQTEIDALQEQVEEAKRREDELRQRRTEERRANEQVIRAEQALKALEQARQRKVELAQRRDTLSVDKGIFEDLRAAFGRNGIPAMIIEAAIPELEEEANHLLNKMTEGRMHVRLDTQREKRTGGVAETLDILISDELGTRAYESYSGGEAFRVNFAIRVALSQMLARRAGAQLRTLFVDEGFGTQDEAGRQRLVEAINSVQEQFDLLLVITHIDELRDAFPVQIEITKTPDGSRVRLR
ncbi:MAG: SMC family ATPase [Anaerolineae bacterium]|nr:SMC family ATPase [Anaerolineae bacterium]